MSSKYKIRDQQKLYFVSFGVVYWRGYLTGLAQADACARGDSGDKYRTAALNISVGDYSVGFNLFTGYRDYENENGSVSKHRDPLCIDDFGRRNPNGVTPEIGTKYRLGALTVGYRGYGAGVNSEHVRHSIQNQAIHNLKFGPLDKRQMGFENQSPSGLSIL